MIGLHNTNGETMMVNNDEIEYYLSMGWSLGYNNGANKGKISVNNGTTNKRIEPELLNDYIFHGWELGWIHKLAPRINIYKNDKMKLVYEEELDIYLSDGWQKGKLYSSTKNRIKVNKDNITKHITKDELEEYLCYGWERGEAKILCHYCKNKFSPGNHNRWHGERCKSRH